MLRELIATLKAVGKSTELHQTDDGTRILVLPYGGRILGVFAPGSEENFLWTNSALNSVESAQTYYASDDWQNSGGDRTWVAPEVDFFFPKFPNVDIAGYWQPRSLDPGNYELTKTNHGVKLTNRLNIEGFRSKKRSVQSSRSQNRLRLHQIPCAMTLRFGSTQLNMPGTRC